MSKYLILGILLQIQDYVIFQVGISDKAYMYFLLYCMFYVLAYKLRPYIFRKHERQTAV